MDENKKSGIWLPYGSERKDVKDVVEIAEAKEDDELSGIWPEWKIEKALGRGAFGTVYKAVRQENGVKSASAIKVIEISQNTVQLDMSRLGETDVTASKTFMKNVVDEFVNEVQVMEEFKGIQNIVSIEDYKVVEKKEEIGWDIYIRMELLMPFEDYVCDKKLEEEEVIQLGCDICTALEICAKKDVVHRDIKPENVFVNEFGNYKLGDFGVSKKLEAFSVAMSIKGTPNYMAPEVCKMEGADARSDIYSLGIMLYRLLNGNRFPFWETEQILNPNEKERALNRRIKGEALPRPSEASPAMADLILKACAHKPEKRFQSASEMKQALLAVKKGTYNIEEAHTNESARPDLNKTVGADDLNVAAREKSVVQNGGATSVDGSKDLSNGEKKKTYTFCGFRRRTKRRIAVAMVAALLIGGGALVVPRIMDSFSEEASQNQNSSGEENQDASVTNSPTEGTKEPESNLTGGTVVGGATNADNKADASGKTENEEVNKNNENKDDEQTTEYSKADEEKIASILGEAEQLAGTEDYEGALGKIQAGLAVYPKSVELQGKLEEYTKQKAVKEKETTLNMAAEHALNGDYQKAMAVIEEAQKEAPGDAEYKAAYEKYAADYETATIQNAISQADLLVQEGNYEEAITILENTRKEFPDSVTLNDKLAMVKQEQATALAAQKKKQTLEEAEKLAANGDYEQAMAVVETAQKEVPEDADYAAAYNKYYAEYKKGIVDTAIASAEAEAGKGAYLEALHIVNQATEKVGEDATLQTAAGTYEDAYVKSVSAQVDKFLEEQNIASAKEVLEEASKEFPENTVISERKEEVDSYKTVSLSTLTPINGGFKWNEGTPEDPFNGNYSEVANYTILHGKYCDDKYTLYTEYYLEDTYQALVFDISPHSSFGESSSSYVQIYVNDVLRYTSPEITRKSKSIRVNVDISDAEYIKIVVVKGKYGCLMLSDVVLLNMPGYESEVSEENVSLSLLEEFNGSIIWNEGYPVNIFNDSYFDVENYAIMHGNYCDDKYTLYAEYYLGTVYKTINFDIAPYRHFDQNDNGVSSVLKVYVDDKLKYTSPAITKKTQKFSTGDIDVTGADYLKIVLEKEKYGCVIISDVLLEPAE